MQNKAFEQHAHAVLEWIKNYQKNIESYPVKSTVQPKEIFNQLPQFAPLEPEHFNTILDDLQNIILPGITHWQHPKFFAYYPANTSAPSILAEMITATLGLQCMSWQTSPAATELEEKVIRWLITMLGLPAGFDGVIQDSASSATFCSLLTAREKKTDFQTNAHGLYHQKPFTLYCSEEAHSSIEKAVRMAGLGYRYLRKIPVDAAYRLDPKALEAAIQADIANGFTPLWVVAALGTTSATAFDPLAEIATLCQQYNIWLHVDAAYAGSAFLLPEQRHYLSGIEYADSFVFNPHKWLFTNFDCSVYFVKDKKALINCFEILPEYLKTEETEVNNYRDWGPGLGRRFRALKLWFVIRSFGVKGLQARLREHISLAQHLSLEVAALPDFEICAPVTLNNICFRYHPVDIHDEEALNALNATLLSSLNKTGELYLTHTKLSNRYVLRLVIAQTNTEAHHVKEAWDLIQKTARSLSTNALQARKVQPLKAVS